MNPTIRIVGAMALACVTLLPARAQAHCDTLDGPVVAAARRALESGDVNQVLFWVDVSGEDEVRVAFRETLAVRSLGPQARALADRYFFETVVRVHRSGEGEPYTGLKPAGLDLGPAIPAADRSLDLRRPDDVQQLLSAAIAKQLRAHFDEVMEAKDFKPGDLAAGRRFVRAYVTYLHYVEQLYEASQPAHDAHLHETVK